MNDDPRMERAIPEPGTTRGPYFRRPASSHRLFLVHPAGTTSGDQVTVFTDEHLAQNVANALGYTVTPRTVNLAGLTPQQRATVERRHQ